MQLQATAFVLNYGPSIGWSYCLPQYDVVHFCHQYIPYFKPSIFFFQNFPTTVFGAKFVEMMDEIPPIFHNFGMVYHWVYHLIPRDLL